MDKFMIITLDNGGDVGSDSGLSLSQLEPRIKISPSDTANIFRYVVRGDEYRIMEWADFWANGSRMDCTIMKSSEPIYPTLQSVVLFGTKEAD